MAVTAFKFLIINYYISWCLNVAGYLYRALQDNLMVAKGHELTRDTVPALSSQPFHISIKRHFIAVFVSKSGLQNRCSVNPYPTAFPYGNGMVLHFYQQQESSTNKTVHKVINKGLKAYV